MNTFKGAKMNLSKFNVWREGMGNKTIGNTSVGGESMENDPKLSQLASTLETLIDRKVGTRKIGSGDTQIVDAIISVVNSLLQNTKYKNGLSSTIAMKVAKGLRV
jgi:hypothetical protein